MPTQATNAIHVQYDPYDSCDCFKIKRKIPCRSTHSSKWIKEHRPSSHGSAQVSRQRLQALGEASGRHPWQNAWWVRNKTQICQGSKATQKRRRYTDTTYLTPIIAYNNKFIFQRLWLFLFLSQAFIAGKKRNKQNVGQPFRIKMIAANLLDLRGLLILEHPTQLWFIWFACSTFGQNKIECVPNCWFTIINIINQWHAGWCLRLRGLTIPSPNVLPPFI